MKAPVHAAAMTPAMTSPTTAREGEKPHPRLPFEAVLRLEPAAFGLLLSAPAVETGGEELLLSPRDPWRPLIAPRLELGEPRPGQQVVGVRPDASHSSAAAKNVSKRRSAARCRSIHPASRSHSLNSDSCATSTVA